MDSLHRKVPRRSFKREQRRRSKKNKKRLQRNPTARIKDVYLDYLERKELRRKTVKLLRPMKVQNMKNRQRRKRPWNKTQMLKSQPRRPTTDVLPEAVSITMMLCAKSEVTRMAKTMMRWRPPLAKRNQSSLTFWVVQRRNSLPWTTRRNAKAWKLPARRGVFSEGASLVVYRVWDQEMKRMRKPSLIEKPGLQTFKMLWMSLMPLSLSLVLRTRTRNLPEKQQKESWLVK